MALPATLRTGAARTSLRSIASCSSRTATVAPSQRRELHYLPPTPQPLQKGCMPFLSKGTVDTLWNEWQKGLLERLNAEVRGTELESSTLIDTVIQSSQKPEKILAFNYASLALNNAFFLSHLSPDPATSQDLSDESWKDRSPPQPTKYFKRLIESHFGSVTEFKSAFSAAALGMSSSGWVWLVLDAQGKMGIVPTYGAGTILVQNRMQRGLPAVEASAASSSPYGSTSSTSDSPLDVTGSVPALAQSLRNAGNSSRTGRELYPLLCLSVHEHAWLPDWGIWGKENYLSRFWEVVDWEKVSRVRDAYSNKSLF